MMSHPSEHMVDGIDIAALRKKYAEERDRRLNPQHNEQFVEVVGDFGHYAADIWAGDVVPRAPIEVTVEALVIGGGFGGLLTAAELTKVGITDFHIIEQAADFGGTWYWNRYPGLQCDIDSYIYLPLLEETGYIPTEKYAHGPEIFEHAQRIGRHFDLYSKALFQTQVKDMTWQEEDRRWTITTDRGDIVRARFVFSSSGILHRPKLPGIRGIARFKGRMFHTSRWDYDYTGGTSKGGMDRLADKRIAVIGTGATGIQCVPHLARDAQHVFVVQRTPSAVRERGNGPTDPIWASALQPGWQRRRMDNFTRWTSGIADGEDMVRDGWTALFYDLSTAGQGATSPEEGGRIAELADFMKGEEARRRVDSTIARQDVAEALKPWYNSLCKRPAFSDLFYPAFNRDNVALIDTMGRGLDEITENAIVFDGVQYPVDCIIFATGYEVGTDYSRRADFAVHGVGGRTLTEHFAGGMRTLHGFHVNGFPNLFLLGAGHNGINRNFTAMLAGQAEHLVGLIRELGGQGVTRIEATAQAEAEWLRTLVDKSQGLRSYLAACTPGYFNGEGDVANSFVANTYGEGPLAFDALLDEWRARGDYRGLTAV
jgi:cyclohexanone monooxygenase